MGIRKNCVAVNKRRPSVTACGPLCAPPLLPAEDVPTDQGAPTCGPFPRDERRSRRKHRRFCCAGAATTARSAGGCGDGR